MPKNKSHKGLLKRIRITKSGKVKMHRAFGRHLKSHKTGSVIRKYRRPKYACGADVKRLSVLLCRPVRSGDARDAAPATAPEAAAE